LEISGPLLDTPLHIVCPSGDLISISTLDRDTAQRHAARLVSIHNLIPFVRWTERDLLADQIGTRIFYHKWDLSLLIVRGSDESIGFLVSYLRPPDGNFQSMSVYMHRMAILSALQRRGIGKQVVSIYLQRLFTKLRVDHVTLQTNDNAENARIIALYEGLGFVKIKRVFYPDKTDWLMACSRMSANSTGHGSIRPAK
jgi:ribosomal protein S18 acetylase RimI-like enzyme